MTSPVALSDTIVMAVVKSPALLLAELDELSGPEVPDEEAQESKPVHC